MQEMQVRPLGWENTLEEGMVTHYTILVWELPWTEEPGGLQSMGSQRVTHDLVTDLRPFRLGYLPYEQDAGKPSSSLCWMLRCFIRVHLCVAL